MITRERGLLDWGLHPGPENKGVLAYTPLHDVLFLPSCGNEKPPLNLNSAVLLGWLWRTSNQRASEFKLYQTSIARMVGMSPRGVKNALQELEAMGLIRFSKPSGPKAEYEITLRRIPQAEELYRRKLIASPDARPPGFEYCDPEMISASEKSNAEIISEYVETISALTTENPNKTGALPGPLKTIVFKDTLKTPDTLVFKEAEASDQKQKKHSEPMTVDDVGKLKTRLLETEASACRK